MTSILPKTVSISELADVNPKTDISALRPNSLVSFIPMADVSEEGRWLGRQERELKDVRVGYTPFSEGDILFAKITPCMENGKGSHAIGLKNGFGFGSTEFHVLRAISGNDSRFIFHWLQAKSTRTRAIAFMGGSAGQQRVQPDFFSRYEVPCIDSSDQTRIAHVLDTIDKTIARSEAVIAKLKQIRAGLLHNLLTCGLDEDGQLRDPIAHPDHFKESPLGRIPREWEVKPFNEMVASATDGPFGSNLKTQHYVDVPGVRVVRLQNIGSGMFDDTDKAFVSADHAATLQRHQTVAGDLLVASMGDENHPLAPVQAREKRA